MRAQQANLLRALYILSWNLQASLTASFQPFKAHHTFSPATTRQILLARVLSVPFFVLDLRILKMQTPTTNKPFSSTLQLPFSLLLLPIEELVRSRLCSHSCPSANSKLQLTTGKHAKAGVPRPRCAS